MFGEEKWGKQIRRRRRDDDFYSWGDGVGSRAPDAGLPRWDGTCVGWRRAATAGGVRWQAHVGARWVADW
jgi:hypothetical protein